MQPSAGKQGESGFEQTGQRIGRLLEELQPMVSPLAWQRLDELVRGLVELYGTGLTRLLTVAIETRGPPELLRERLANDELVSGLLALHGMHPLPPETRIERALMSVRPFFDAQALMVDLMEVDAQGRARLRVIGMDDGRSRPAGAIRTALIEAIEAAAPEVRNIEIEGIPGGDSGPHLVQLNSRGAQAGKAEASP